MFIPTGKPDQAVATAPFVIAGVGSASRASVDEIIALIADCLFELDLSPNHLVAIATHLRKASDPVLNAVARHYNVPLQLLDKSELEGSRTGSDFVLATVGVPSVAEAAAMANGALALPKRKSAYATCALATIGENAPGFGWSQLSSANAAMAASTVPTSRAAP